MSLHDSEAKVRGGPLERFVLVSANEPHHRRSREAHFIQTIAATDQYGLPRAEFGNCPGERVEELRLADAEELVRGVGGVRERAEQVEDRADAELLAKGRDVGHAAMEVRGEAEREADAVEALLRPLGSGLDVRTEFAEYVGTSRSAGDGAVAVLHHGNAGPRGHECGGGADVERAALVAAGAARIEDRSVDRHEVEHLLAEHVCRSGDFTRGFALHAKCGEERASAHLVHATGHEVANRLGHAAAGNVLPGEQEREQLGEPRWGRKLQEANSVWMNRPNSSPLPAGEPNGARGRKFSPVEG